MLLTNTHTGERYELIENEYYIGRSEYCDIVIREPTLSRKHARLFRSGNEWFVEDLGSTNGITLNGIRLAEGQRCCVRAGDRLVLGTVVPLAFEKEEEEEEQTVGVQFFRKEREPSVRMPEAAPAEPVRPAWAQPRPAWDERPVRPAEEPAPAQPAWDERPAAMSAPVQPAAAPIQAEPAEELTFRRFVETLAQPGIRRSITAAAIILYVCCAITLVLGLVAGNYGVLIDVAVILPLTILMQVKKSKGFAIALVCIAALEFALTTVMTGQVGGWLPLLGSVSALLALLQADKAYKTYIGAPGSTPRF